MVKTVLEIEGMSCEMCEAHINDAVRRAFPVKKVTSSHKKGRTEIISEEPIPEAALRETIDATGYTLRGVSESPAVKGLFGWK